MIMGLMFVSCTGRFKDLNTDKTGITDEDMQVDHVVALRSKGEDDLANMLPACRSCNHYKRGNSLEGWRRILEAMPATLERDCYTYRQAVRFGMVKPTPKKITFYFERRCI